MPVFPSQEWIAAYCATLERDPRAGAMAQALNGVYRFVIEPSGPVTERHSYDVSITPDGTGAVVRPLAPPAAEPRLTIAAAYPRWLQLLRGELDIPIAVMLRRIRVSGDLRAVTSNLDDARPLLDALSRVDTQAA
jgi:SCP-2 sterol transfer family